MQAEPRPVLAATRAGVESDEGPLDMIQAFGDSGDGSSGSDDEPLSPQIAHLGRLSNESGRCTFGAPQEMIDAHMSSPDVQAATRLDLLQSEVVKDKLADQGSARTRATMQESARTFASVGEWTLPDSARSSCAAGDAIAAVAEDSLRLPPASHAPPRVADDAVEDPEVASIGSSSSSAAAASSCCEEEEDEEAEEEEAESAEDEEAADSTEDEGGRPPRRGPSSSSSEASPVSIGKE